MKNLITVTGLVATEPNHIITSEGLSISNFRLVSSQRKYDKSQDKWVDAEANWYTITMFRQLATNFTTSVKRGDRVLVTGRLKIREWDNGEKKGITAEIEADAIGHDLSWGTTSFSRTIGSVPATAQTAVGEFPTSADEFPALAEEFPPSGARDDDGVDPDPAPLSSFTDSSAVATPF